jgi:hypothetical protein
VSTILFPTKCETPALESQLEACLLVGDIAERLYQARSLWIGGGTVPWSQLTTLQRAGYRTEISALIQGGDAK